MNTYGIVLAAGKGTRMKSKQYKVLHKVCGKPMIEHVIGVLNESGVNEIVTIVGYGAEAVKEHVGNRTSYALQEEQLGTGHAVRQAEKLLTGKKGTTIVICGDTPLVTAESIQGMLALHNEKKAAATIMTAQMDDPKGYGRIVRDETGTVAKIVEQKDCTEEESRITEINTGTYCFDNEKMFSALGRVTNNNAQQEYYLTDVIAILKKDQERIEGYTIQDADEGIGINDRIALAEAEQIMRARITKRHMIEGVTIIDPANTYIDADVTIGSDTVIYPGTHIRGASVIGSGCMIGPNTEIIQSSIGDEVTVKQSVITESSVGKRTAIGPFAYIRPGSKIGASVKIGDFVEIKNSIVQDGSKVPHLSYVGDAEVGKNVNIGCGVITANYDGVAKHKTTIEDGAFIGSNSNLIAPVRVGAGAFVVAGSTITDDVAADAVAIARERQVNKDGYAAKLKNKLQSKANSSNSGGK